MTDIDQWLLELKASNSKYFVETGIYYGYPTCCIHDFIKLTPASRTAAQNDVTVHRHTGFIPCPEHARAIQAGEITLESLIKNRQCKTAFPIGDHD